MGRWRNGGVVGGDGEFILFIHNTCFVFKGGPLSILSAFRWNKGVTTEALGCDGGVCPPDGALMQVPPGSSSVYI